MNEGNDAILVFDDQEYDLNHYKIQDDSENYFCTTVKMKFSGECPDVDLDESYVARLIVNGDAVWYFPWVGFKKVKGQEFECSVYGAIFCPFGLSEEEENRYDAINDIVASEICYELSGDVWKHLLFVFSDWLKAKSVPQYKEYRDLANEIEDDEDENDDEEEDEDEDEDEEN